MTRAISRDSFNELKNYLGVYLQQGRVVLDSDWNESQDIGLSLQRRLAREAVGEGSPNQGFSISPAFPPPIRLPEQQAAPSSDIGEALGQIIGICLVDLVTILMDVLFGSIPFFLSFPGFKLDGFEAASGWALSSPQGRLRLARDRPYEGQGFLRASGHAGAVELIKTLPNVVDLSAFELATFHFRLNQQVPGDYEFFLEDLDGRRSVWRLSNPALARDVWLPAFAAPLDLRFHILTRGTVPGFQNSSYESPINAWSGTLPSSWAVVAGALPPGLTLSADDSTEDQRIAGQISGTPTATGTFDFTVRATDANGLVATRALRIVVNPPLPPGDTQASLEASLNAMELLGDVLFAQLMSARTSAPGGIPADLTRIQKYGFKIYQDASTPLVWDFDDLALGSSALRTQQGQNNFIIRGSEFNQFLNQLSLLSLFQAGANNGGGGGGGEEDPDEFFQNLLALMNTNFELVEPSIENAGRYYVHGFPCVQIQDQLYSQQADPNDPPLAPPATGVRTDTVYLDVWTEPVTYVEDPEVREVALGGPDTSTRLRARHRVRVSQGGDLPSGDGRGLGSLATEGNYTGVANRLYLVEIDTPGNLGAATLRWSEDNASTIQRVIEAIPPGSMRVVVEDAAGFHPGDKILLCKEFGSEEHTVAAVFANVIQLQNPTGSQLAALPAATRVPGFTTFSLADRPKVQRWNAFRVPIPVDADDSSISAAIPLNDGVAVRFGGRDLRAGDYWNFRTRYLAGDPSSGLDPAARIEPLAFEPPKGVIHHYAPLARLTRDAAALDPQKIEAILDLRERAGNASTTAGTLPDLQVIDGDNHHVGGLPLPRVSKGSKVLVFWSGNLFINSRANASSSVDVQVAFYNDQIGDPESDPDSGKIQDRVLTVKLGRKALGTEIPLSLMFVNSGLNFAFLPTTAFRPSSVHVFLKGSDDSGTDVELTDMQLVALELKKSF
ncbi:MAG TPA: DUF6519 domain-containing protein [Polyangiaceae bacterium]|nr:DUF6519 domain-containing protein [Polyangiaceae bacterium]